MRLWITVSSLIQMSKSLRYIAVDSGLSQCETSVLLDYTAADWWTFGLSY